MLARYGDRRAWVTLDTAPDPPAVATALQEALGLPPGQEPWAAIDAALHMAPALLLLDNLENSLGRAPHRDRGPARATGAHPGLALMVSLRSGAVPPRPAWGTRLEAHRLVPPHDGDLLRAIAADIPLDDPLLPHVLRALDGWPLAIELFAAQADGLGGLAATWRRWQAERTAMLDRGEAAPGRLSSLAVSLGFSLASPRMRLAPPHADAPGRLYAMLGRLPDGMLLDDADALMPGVGAAAAHAVLRARLAHHDGGRIRMLAPVREHAARSNLTRADGDALHSLYLGLAAALRRYFNGDYADIDLPRLRAELVNLDALIFRAVDPAATTDPAASFQRELGSLSLAVGDAYRELGQLAQANAHYQLGFNVVCTLTTCDPSNTEWQRYLSLSWESSAACASSHGDLAGALDAYNQSQTIRAKLAAADPGNAQWQRDLIVSYVKLASIAGAAPQPAATATYNRRALDVARMLAATGRLAPGRRLDGGGVGATPRCRRSGIGRATLTGSGPSPADHCADFPAPRPHCAPSNLPPSLRSGSRLRTAPSPPSAILARIPQHFVAAAHPRPSLIGCGTYILTPGRLFHAAMLNLFLHARANPSAIPRPREHERTQETTRSRRAERTQDRSHIYLPAEARANPRNAHCAAERTQAHSRARPASEARTNPRMGMHRRRRTNPSGPSRRTTSASRRASEPERARPNGSP